MISLADFLGRPKTGASQFFPGDGGGRTVLVSSHIWWVDCIAYAFIRLGWNVLITEPWYSFFTNDELHRRFDDCWNFWLAEIRRHDVELVLGGNSTAIVPHPRTGELLHNAAGVPLVNYWWDEPRQMPPLMRRGHTLNTYLAALRDPATINAIWDGDIAREMSEWFGLDNVMHLPLATEPALWPQRSVPLARRQIAVNFLGNCFHHENWETAHDPQVVRRATAVGAVKAANLDLPMVECVGQAAKKGEFPAAHFKAGESDESLRSAFSHWATLEMVLRQRLRYDRIRALAAHLGDRLVICGKGWQALGITPHKEHSGIPSASDYYLASKASLNLFGGCVHSGMPLRPFEIACSGGLIVTQHNRELPELFEPGRECLAFRDNEELIAQIDRVLASPGEFDHMIEAARQRTLARHTWRHRVERLLLAVEERFALFGRPSAVPSTMVS